MKSLFFVAIFQRTVQNFTEENLKYFFEETLENVLEASNTRLDYRLSFHENSRIRGENGNA